MKRYFIKVCLIFSLLILFSSCSRINVAAQDHYKSVRFRHGIIPLSAESSKKLSEASVSRGKDLYTNHCLSCHGQKGLGDGPIAIGIKMKPANLQKMVKEVPNFKFFMSISQWQGDMPGWKDQFSELDREDLTAYIKTFK